VGGGHAHVQLLRRWITEPFDGARVTVVLDRPEAVYSGMVPGFAAGDYAARELEIDVAALAERAGARVLLTPAIGVDPSARQIALAGQPALAWDVASLDVGSTVRGLDLPGVREHALATRPIRHFVDRLEARLADVTRRGRSAVRVAVVGAGAAGVELGFTLRARLLAAGASPEMTVLSGEPAILPGYPRRVVERVRREAERRRIAIRVHGNAVAVTGDAVQLERGQVSADLVAWATGAAPLPFLASSPLPQSPDGFIRVRRTLQVAGHDDLFAVGDCATLEDAPWVRKAGVYAVREGPVLERNLRARLAGRGLASYRPQRDVLSLLNLGQRQALAAKWGAVAVGGWVWRWKDWIDRRFVDRFRL
jgi:selenide,water dikinase